eukprot:PhF_6_TR13231/c0_g1_i1/m.20934/K22145/TMEM18; transmembrane protein 18
MDSLLSSFMEAPEQFMTDLYHNVTTGPGVIDGVTRFVNAVEWQQTPFYWLVGLHVSLYVMALLLRKHPVGLFSLFCFLTVLIVLAQVINDVGNTYWKTIGFTQNYFDKHGIFISAVYSAPMLVLAVFLVFGMVAHVSVLLVKVKRRQFVAEAKKKAKAEGGKPSAPIEDKKRK